MDIVPSKNEQSVMYKNSLYVLFGKRALDILVCWMLAVPFLVFFVIIGVLIKLESKGPILFKQTRLGKDGREFQIIKFRTMYVNTPEQARSPFNDHDPRVTKIGRFLRKTSLDELPQLINILKGEMSVVGPRPEQKMIVEKYYTSCEKMRFQARPGITGLWQISKDRTAPIHENLHHDLTYIREMSLTLDLKIILKTMLVVLKSNTF